METVRRLLLVVLVICVVSMAGNIRVQAAKPTVFNVAHITVDEFFPNAEGTFILKDVETDTMYIYNGERAGERQAPQATFAIINDLIGLQVKAPNQEDEQAMARDIGQLRMQEWLRRCSYGNQDISGGIDRFWLNSSLKISPFEQADFLENLYKETLPFDKGVMRTVKKALLQQAGANCYVAAKTGSSSNPSVGWYVGFVTANGHPYVFVTNVDAPGEAGGVKAQRITLGILQKYKLVSQ